MRFTPCNVIASMWFAYQAIGQPILSSMHRRPYIYSLGIVRRRLRVGGAQSILRVINKLFFIFFLFF